MMSSSPPSRSSTEMPSRHRKDSRLPPYVYARTRVRKSDGKEVGEYVWVPWVPRGEQRRTIRLCSWPAPLSRVWREFERRQEKRVQTVAWLLDAYLGSESFRRKAATTRGEQERQASFLKRYRVRARVARGDVLLNQLTPGRITQYAERRAKEEAPVGGNREIALLGRAWDWALSRDHTTTPNPCPAAELNPERARDRYVNDREYAAVLELARGAPQWWLPVAMELARTCRMRRIEILRCTRTQVLPEGLDTRRVKGSRDTITRWSPRLREAVRAAQENGAGGLYLLQNRHGAPITVSAWNSAWRRLMKRWVEQGGAAFHFHDLKAKGVSDFEGDKQAASGHKSARTVAIYDRKKPIVDATD